MKPNCESLYEKREIRLGFRELGFVVNIYSVKFHIFHSRIADCRKPCRPESLRYFQTINKCSICSYFVGKRTQLMEFIKVARNILRPVLFFSKRKPPGVIEWRFCGGISFRGDGERNNRTNKRYENKY